MGRKPFGDWIKAQAPKRLTPAEAEVVADIAGGFNATTEARAYVRSFLASFQAGATGEAAKGLASYARQLEKKISDPGEGSRVKAELTQELRTAYRQMTPDMRKQFDAAMAEAKKANPTAWVSQIDFTK